MRTVIIFSYLTVSEDYEKLHHINKHKPEVIHNTISTQESNSMQTGHITTTTGNSKQGNTNEKRSSKPVNPHPNAQNMDVETNPTSSSNKKTNYKKK